MALLQHPNVLSQFMTLIALTPLQTRIINVATRQQANSMLWFSIRRGRITARNFHIAINQAKKTTAKISNIFLTSLVKSKDISNQPAVRYGIDNEAQAKVEYEEKEGVKVYKCGIFISQCGMLGASPYGIVSKEGIIEIKCPYKLKDSTELNDLTRMPYIKKVDEGVFRLVKTHKCYDQIQGNIYMSKRKWCDLVIWSNKLFYVIRVERETSWGLNIGLLQHFYLDRVLPTLIQYYNGYEVQES